MFYAICCLSHNSVYKILFRYVHSVCYIEITKFISFKNYKLLKIYKKL